MKTKICGISDIKTLEFLTQHPSAPQFIGFILNYPKSKRNVGDDQLYKLINTNKQNSLYVAVLVKPDQKILKKIESLPFDYYQIYDCTAEEIRSIKKKYKIKIITALTIENQNDVEKYSLFETVTDIYLFDSKGYEKSMTFNHKLIENIKVNKELMIAGNIQIDDNLEYYKKIADIIDISGGLETYGLKDFSKIEIFLNKIKQINNEA